MKAVTSGVPPNGRESTVLLLQADQGLIGSTFADFESVRPIHDKQKNGIEQCPGECAPSRIDGQVFYTPFTIVPNDRDMVAQATVEHFSLKELIALAVKDVPEEDVFEVTMKVLSEYVNQHVNKEQTEASVKAVPREIHARFRISPVRGQTLLLQSGSKNTLTS